MADEIPVPELPSNHQMARKAEQSLKDYLFDKALQDIAALQTAHNTLASLWKSDMGMAQTALDAVKLDLTTNYVKRRNWKRYRVAMWALFLAMAPTVVGWVVDWVHTMAHTYHLVHS